MEGYHGGVILIITTLKEKLSRRRREVYRQRVSVIFLFQKQVGVGVVVGSLYNTILPSHFKIRGAFFVAKVGCHVDEEFECWV